MTAWTKHLVVGALVALASCENKARLVENSGETGGGEDSAGTLGGTGSGSNGQQSTGASSSGTEGGSGTAAPTTGTLGLGVSGIVVFEPVPEFLPESQAVITLLGREPNGPDDEAAELVSEITVPVSMSPSV